MIVYNQAFDLYHSIFRILHFLKKFEDGAKIEIERIRIWDFYLLFPHEIGNIRLRKSDKLIRKIKKTYFPPNKNPYLEITEDRKVFEKIKPYQLAALNCIASYGIISKKGLIQQIVHIKNKGLVDEFVTDSNDLPPRDQNVIAIMTSEFYQISLFGKDGLKNRTNLIENRYDA